MVLRPWGVLQDTVVLNIEAFLAVMNTTKLVVKIRPEKALHVYDFHIFTVIM